MAINVLLELIKTQPLVHFKITQCPESATNIHTSFRCTLEELVALAEVGACLILFLSEIETFVANHFII